ncbi:MAG: flagellar protein FlgN [Desulfobacterales bacterium]|nr:flagellar protein FlgN [Desulfobacterales bacterium]
MQRAIETLEDLLHKKILLYQDLVAGLKREREALINTDMEALWEIADEKQSIVSDIEALRCKILTALSEVAIDHRMDVVSFDIARVCSFIPGTHSERIKEPYVSLVNLKSEIRKRSREHIVFIEESLRFLDELIGIIAGAADEPKPVYYNGRSLTGKRQANVLLHREV